MNLKDRLIISNNNNLKTQNQNGEYVYTTEDIFPESKKAGELIRDLINSERNIIFIHNKDFDSNLFINYIQILMRDKQINLHPAFDENQLSNISKINLIKDPKIYDIVKIFEYIIYGYKNFIFNLCLKSSNNITEKISTLIAVNYTNLTEKNINTLISSSNPVIVTIEKGNASFIISSVSEITEDLAINKLFSQTEQIKIETKINNIIETTAETENEINEVKTESNIDDDLINYNSDEHKIKNILNEDADENPPKETEDIEEEKDKTEKNITSAKKDNKYKLLREKVRNRKKETN